MQPSTPNSNSDDAVSEVLGTILTFLIVTAILTVAMIALRSASADAEREAGRHGAEGVADRVAESIEALAPFVADPAHAGSDVALRVDLPQTLAGAGYTVTLIVVPAGSAACQAAVSAPTPFVVVQRDADCIERRLAGSSLPICADPLGTKVGGGPLVVAYGAPMPPGCAPNTIFLRNPS